MHHLSAFIPEYQYTELFKQFEFEGGNKGIPGLCFVMTHPHLWKDFYFKMVRDHPSQHEWGSLMEKEFDFSEGYHTIQRSDSACLSPLALNHNVPITETTNPVDALQKSHINGCFDKEKQSESKTIQKYVAEFICDITKNIGRSNKRLAATSILSGSAAEGTKVGFLDEYDFILHMGPWWQSGNTRLQPLRFQSPAQPQVGKLVVGCLWLAVYSGEP